MKANVIYSNSPKQNKLSVGKRHFRKEGKNMSVLYEDAEQTCDRLASYITKLERENEYIKNELEEAQEKLESFRKENKGWESYIKELKEQNECYKTDNKNLIETAEILNKRNDALENEISKISALFNEKENTIIKRDNEIDALKHMLDRKEDKYVSFNSYFR